MVWEGSVHVRRLPLLESLAAKVMTFPFPIPATLMAKLPPPSRDGKHYLDVCVAGKWDGILVVDGNGMCLGIYVARRITEWELPFTANDIEDIRRASLWHRFLAALPFEPWNSALLTVFVFSPIALLLGWFVWPLFALFFNLRMSLSNLHHVPSHTRMAVDPL